MLDRPEKHDNTHGCTVLVNYLTKHYSPDHDVFLYVASQYPHMGLKVERCNLKQLPEKEMTRLTTLYVPPAHESPRDEFMIKALSLSDAALA